MRELAVYLRGPDDVVPLGTTMGKLLFNLYTHAFPSDRDGHARLSRSKSPEGGLVLEMADSGVGLPETVNPMHPRTLELRPGRGLAEGQLQGRLSVSRNGDTRTSRTFRSAIPARRTAP